MRERAERVGIALDISSVPGQGTDTRALARTIRFEVV